MEDFTFWFYGKRKPVCLSADASARDDARTAPEILSLSPHILHPPPADIPHGKTGRGSGGGGPFRGGSAPGFGSPVSLSLHIPAPLFSLRRCLAVRRGMCCSVRLFTRKSSNFCTPCFSIFPSQTARYSFFIVPSFTCRPSFPAASLFFANTSTPSTG